MPELPEVQTVVNGLKPVLESRKILHVQLRRPNLRFPFDSDLQMFLEGNVVDQVKRRAKYILLTLKHHPERLLIWHLGMSGQVLIYSPEQIPESFNKHDHVILTTDIGYQIRFRDPRRFGFIKLLDKNKIHELLKLGPEPFSKEFSADYLYKMLKNKKAPIKNALLDQRIVAGLGNIYVLEALHLTKIHPEKPSNCLLISHIQTLIVAIRNVLEKAIESGGSSLRDHVQTNGKMGYFQHSFNVYGREGKSCLTCQQGVIKRIVQAGRSSFYCPECQLGA